MFILTPRGWRTAIAVCLLLFACPTWAQVPQIIGFQGRVTVDGVNFDSTTAGHPGVFRFALVNADGTTTYWSNDGTSSAGSEPTAGVSLPVSKGLYSVYLGDTTGPAAMSPIGPSVFANPDVRLRVWFDDGVHGSQLLTPDQRVAAVGYAVMAGNVPDGAITAGKIAAGAVGTAQLAPGAVDATKVADGALGNAKLANSGVTIATGSGLTGGGPLSLGGTLTLENVGVLSLAGGGGVTVSGNTGTVTLGTNATSLNIPSTLVTRDSDGMIAASTFVGDLLGNADSAVVALSALTANTASSAVNFTGGLLGDVTGLQGATVVQSVGGTPAASIAAGVGLANAATDANTASSLVKRDANGNFAAGTVTATHFIGDGAGLTGIPGTLAWQNVTSSAQQAEPNTGYLASHSAEVTVTLPPTPALGDIVRVAGVGAGGWRIAPAGGQSITGFGAGLGPVGSAGTGAAVQYVGANLWQPINELQLAPASVSTGHIADAAITTPKLAAGAVDNTKLANSGITIATGPGLSGGGPLSLGGTLTLENAGVLSLAGGGGITVSGNTGAITLGTNATSLNIPSTLVTRDANGSISASTFTGDLLGNADTATLALSANTAVFAQSATSAGSAATAGSALNFTGSLLGDVTGLQGSTVVENVGGVSAANVATGASLANAGTPANSANTLVKRDASGNFAAGNVTAAGFVGSGAGLTSVPGTVVWSAVTGTTHTAQPNTGYVANNAAQVAITLPATPAIGDVVHVVGQGAGGWKFVPNTGQSVTGFGAGLGPSGAQNAAGAVIFVGSNTWLPINQSILASNSVTASKIASNAVTTAKIAAGAVDSTKLAANAVATASIAAGAVDGTKLAANSVSAGNIAAGAVGTSELAAGAVDNTKLANPSLTINTGVGLQGGGDVALGGSLSLSIPNGGVGAAQLAPGAALANLTSGGLSLGTTGKPTFSGLKILDTATGPDDKPEVLLDRGIIPKGRLTFQRSDDNGLYGGLNWSGLVMSINADWNAATGYVRDDPERSQSILQMEYEWDDPRGYKLNEINWTVNGYRTLHFTTDVAHQSRSTIHLSGVTSVGFNNDNNGMPYALEDESGRLFMAVTRYNNNPVEAWIGNAADTAAGATLTLASATPGNAQSTSPADWTSLWTLGSDLKRSIYGGAPSNNFGILDRRPGGGVRLLIDDQGRIGTGGNINPQHALDVTGDVNITGVFRVNGAVTTPPKQNISRLAVELPTFWSINPVAAIAPGSFTPAALVTDGSTVIKIMSLDPQAWKGRSVKLGMSVSVNGTGAQDLAYRLTINYTTQTFDGATASTVFPDPSFAENSLPNSSVLTTPAPTVSGGQKWIQSEAILIPENVTAICAAFELRKSDVADTNPNNGYIIECRVNEQ